MSKVTSGGRASSTGRLIAGASVALGLVGALVVSLVIGGQNSTLPKSPTLQNEILDPPTTAVTMVGTTSIPVTASAGLLDEAEEAGAVALAAWGRFAVAGDQEVLSGHFHPESPQWALVAEAAADIAADPLGDPPYEFAMVNPTVGQVSSGMVTMEGSIRATRGDGAPSRADWRLTLVWSEESRSWMVWTLEEMD